VEIPTELEALMTVEAQELIKQQYDHLKGSEELTILLARNRNKGEDILALTGVGKKIKLRQMKNTWEFTRRWSMSIRYLELFFHILISQS
jgi:transposase